MVNFFTRNINISFKRFFAILLMISPSLAWFYFFRNILIELQDELISQNIISPSIFDVFFLFYLSIALSAIFGCLICEKANRKKFLGIWILFGIVANFLLFFFNTSTLFLFTALLGGASFGFGFSSSLAFLSDSTIIEERGRISGFVILFAFLLVIIFIGVGSYIESLTISILLALILRTTSLIGLLLDPFERIKGKIKNWFEIVRLAGFKYYFLSWLLFIVADGISNLFENWLPLDIRSSPIFDLGIGMQYMGIVFSSLISGFTSDQFGRKKTILFGLGMLVLSYAFFAISASPITFLIIRLIYGAAVGIIIVNYFTTVIGDFATKGSKERFYTIGAIIPFIFYLSFDLFSGLLNVPLQTSVISSILMMIFFLSIIPLIYAPETLPANILKKRSIETYIKIAKKKIKK